MFKKALEYAGEYKKTTYKAIVFMVLGVTMTILPYFFAYQLILPLLGYGEMTIIDIALRVGGIALCGLLNAILYIHGLELSHISAYNTLKNIRISLQGKLEKQPLGTIQEKGVGVLKKLFIDDIESIELLLAHAIPEGLSNFAVPFIIYVSMFFVDWKLALLSLCSLPVGLFSMKMVFKCGMSKMSTYYGSAKTMNNTIIEYINGMEVVKIFNRDGDSYKRFEKDIVSYRDFTLDWYRVCRPWMSLYNSILPCIAIVTLPLGTWFVAKGYSTLPHFILILCMSFGIGAPLLRALSFMGNIPQLNYKIEALEKEMGETQLRQSTKSFNGKDHTISFENVSFGYDDKEVLHNINLSIETGKLTALVGESGSGKSTLAKLMVHFYDVTNGEILVGGQNIEDMSIESLNNQISYVSQEQFLFNMTIMDNIRIGKPNATDEDVIDAAKKAQCEEFLNRFEKGIYTMAGDGGKQLSGGERQRISLARAILKDAPIIVLDEATAFMDPENEEKMNKAITQIISNKTVIVIAHRLYTIINADKICVLENGNIAGEGTHQQLLENCSEYQKLWNSAQDSAKWMVTGLKGAIQ